MKRLQGFIAGIFTALMLTGIFAVAKNMYEKIDVLYNDVKIEIDGEAFIATDVNGVVVEPFIYNGTTYLPVRAIAEAFDKDVAWDGETFTVSLTSKTEESEGETTENTPVDEADSPEAPEYDANITDEQLLGTWYADVTSMLVSLGVPESIAEKYTISATYEFSADGTYKSYLSEDNVNTIIDASFEYALLAYGISEEQYPQISGISVEETKAQIKAALELTDFTEEGAYRVENGVLYMLVTGNPEKVQNYTYDDGVLTLYENGAELTLVKAVE